ncbi:MAG: trigger factor [Chloroflexi bacterium]|nr:trigger factor [Chloroflexota bacterium]
MECTTTPAEKSTVRLEVTLSVAEVAAAIAQAVRHVAGHSRIPGFRPGKAPRPIVERFAGAQRILDEATEIVIERGYRDAIVKSEIVPLTSPKIDAKPVVEGEPYTFTAVIPVPPEVTLGDYRGFTFAPTFEEPDDSKVDAVISDLRDSYATLTAVTDRGAEMGDYAIIAFDGYRVDNGEAIPGASSERMPIVLGSDRLIPGFEAQLVGAKVGDSTTVEVTFPADYQEASLQGVPAKFDVVINDLRTRVPPPLDDAFAAQVANVSDVAGLRAEVLMRLKASAVDRGRHEFADKIVEFAMDGAKVEIPDPLIEEEIDGLVDELARSIARQGLTFEQYLSAAGKSAEEIRDELRERGERRARTLLVLSAVAGAEGVEVPESLIDEEVERARPQTQGQRKLEAYLTSERGRRAIRASLRRSLVVERLVEEWFDGHPQAWPAWAPERPATPTAADAPAK